MSEVEEPAVAVALVVEPPDWRSERGGWTDSIFRAPEHMRYRRGSDFGPKLVSIGPYYHGRQKLRPMENLKHQCVSDLLKKEPVGGSNMDNLPVEPFKRFVWDVYAFYKEKINYSDEAFVGMLVLDSCFIIRIILSFSQVVPLNMSFLDVNMKQVRSDLLLLENQIPLFFIREVYKWLFLSPNSGRPNFPSFETLLGPFLRLDMPWKMNHNGISIEAAHLLDLYWRCSSSTEIIERVNDFRRHGSNHQWQPSWAETHILIDAPKEMANASELHKMAGIKFQKLNQEGIDHNLDVWSQGLLRGAVLSVVQSVIVSEPFRFIWRRVHGFDLSRASRLRESRSESNGLDRVSNQTHSDTHRNTPSPRDIIFSNGIMRMPCLKIDSSQTTLLVNLIAFESSMLATDRTISSYMKFMDILIDSEKDVELLQQFGVIYNTLSSHKMAAIFFNDIGNFCLIDRKTFISSDLYVNVQKYFYSFWNRNRASLREKYLSSPWAIISLSAGALLLFLSAVQTHYTVHPIK